MCCSVLQRVLQCVAAAFRDESQREARGAHLSGAGRNVTVVARTGPKQHLSIMLLTKILIRAIWFAEDSRRLFFIFSPPGFTSSSRPYLKFSKGESFSIILPRRWPPIFFKSKQSVVKWPHHGPLLTTTLLSLSHTHTCTQVTEK